MRQGRSRMAGRQAVVAAGAAALLLGLALALPSSCSDECTRRSDCAAGQTCVRGSCVTPPGPDADADGSADADADADAEAGTDADSPAEADAEAGADADDVPVGPDADADGDGDGAPDTPVCDCTSTADCPITLPCFYATCNPATGCCEGLNQVPNYCAAGPGATYCEGATWCLDGVQMAGTDGVSRCTDADPPELDNCAPNTSSGACELTVTRTCPW